MIFKNFKRFAENCALKAGIIGEIKRKQQTQLSCAVSSIYRLRPDYSDTLALRSAQNTMQRYEKILIFANNSDKNYQQFAVYFVYRQPVGDDLHVISTIHMDICLREGFCSS